MNNKEKFENKEKYFEKIFNIPEDNNIILKMIYQNYHNFDIINDEINNEKQNKVIKFNNSNKQYILNSFKKCKLSPSGCWFWNCPT